MFRYILVLVLRDADLGVVVDYSNGVSQCRRWLPHKRREHHPHYWSQLGCIRLLPVHTTIRSTLLSWRPCGTTPRYTVLGLAGAYPTLWCPQQYCSCGHGLAPLGAALAPSPAPIHLFFLLMPHYQFELPMTTHRDITWLWDSHRGSSCLSSWSDCSYIYPIQSNYGM